MRSVVKALALAAFALLLVACDPGYHTVCTGQVETHQETTFIPICYSYGKYGCTMYIPTPITENVDYCVGGEWVKVPNATPSTKANQ